jgi:hypothetical protein
MNSKYLWNVLKNGINETRTNEIRIRQEPPVIFEKLSKIVISLKNDQKLGIL